MVEPATPLGDPVPLDSGREDTHKFRAINDALRRVPGMGADIILCGLVNDMLFSGRPWDPYSQLQGGFIEFAFGFVHNSQIYGRRHPGTFCFVV